MGASADFSVLFSSGSRFDLLRLRLHLHILLLIHLPLESLCIQFLCEEPRVRKSRAHTHSNLTAESPDVDAYVTVCVHAGTSAYSPGCVTRKIEAAIAAPTHWMIAYGCVCGERERERERARLSMGAYTCMHVSVWVILCVFCVYHIRNIYTKMCTQIY